MNRLWVFGNGAVPMRLTIRSPGIGRLFGVLIGQRKISGVHMTIAFWCVFVAILLPYGATLFAKRNMPRSENRMPRVYKAQLEGMEQRAAFAEANQFESFPAFAVSERLSPTWLRLSRDSRTPWRSGMSRRGSSISGFTWLIRACSGLLSGRSPSRVFSANLSLPPSAVWVSDQ